SAPHDPEVDTRSGFEQVLRAERVERELRVSLERRLKLYTARENAMAELRVFAPMREVAAAQPTLARMRMKKSPHEIELLQHAADATVAAHRAAWKTAGPGKYEYQVAAVMLSVYLYMGCERNAYPPI